MQQKGDLLEPSSCVSEGIEGWPQNRTGEAPSIAGEEHRITESGGWYSTVISGSELKMKPSRE